MKSVLLVLLLGAAGCRALAGGSDSRGRAWCALPYAHAGVPDAGRMNIDDEFALYAARVPGGFGGLFISPPGSNSVVFHLVEMGKAAEATQVLAGLLRERQPRLAEASLQARQADYDWLELKGCYELAQDTVFAVAGMHGTDIDERRNRLVFRAISEDARQQVLAALRAKRVPAEMVIVEIEEPARLR